MKHFLLMLVFALGLLPARASTLQWVPDPDSLGGMVMPVVTVTNTSTNTGAISVALTQNNLPMAPLREWYLPVAGGGKGYPYANDSFDPSSPWYSALDPSQQNLAFSTQFGFDMDMTEASDPLPSGVVLAIRMVSATPGLTGYVDEWSPDLFQPVFQNPGDTVIWGTLSMWHPVFTSSTLGAVSATFEIFAASLTDTTSSVITSHVVDWTNDVTAVSGYDSAFVTLNWNVVPEPSSAILLASAGATLAWWSRLRSKKSRTTHGFTLMELLLAVTIVSVLTALASAGFSNLHSQAKATQCMSKLRGLGAGILLYAQDHDGEFPRSSHSAYSKGQPGWGRSIIGYLGETEYSSEDAWKSVYARHFVCPQDSSWVEGWSYALNVHFELEAYERYSGKPATWHRLIQVPQPSRTLLLAESQHSGFMGDHIMCHLWSGLGAARNALDTTRHGPKAGAHYVFVDGHVESLNVEETFDPATGVNLWNPSLAR